MLNIGIVGTGRIAHSQLAPALSQCVGAQLWSVLSRAAARGRQFADTHGAKAPEPVHAELRALLSDPALDAIVIASPDKLHAEQTVAAAAAGKHVLVEKPMAGDSIAAKAMVEACHRADVRLGVAYHLRWHAGLRRLVELIRADKLGVLRHMRVQWTWKAADASNWRATPEVGRWWSLGGVGTHCLDLVRWVMRPSCGEISSVKSVVNRSAWDVPHDQTAVLALQFESGSTAEVCSSTLFDSPTRVEIYASDGYALCEGVLGPHGAGMIRLGDQALEFRVANPYLGELDDFVAAIAEGRSPEVDGEEGLRNVELLESAVRDAPD